MQLIIEDSRWYGDGKPKWREARGTPAERRCQSARSALAEQNRAIRLLRQQGEYNDDALELADRLQACTAGNRCGSGACMLCRRAFQRWYVNAAAPLVQPGKLQAARTLMVFAVPDYGQIAIDQLADVNIIYSIKRKFMRRIRELELSIFIGGVDFSLNVNHDRSREYVQVHFQGFVMAEKGKWVVRMTGLLNKSGELLRPLRSEVFDGDLAGIAYTMKTQFIKRESYTEYYNGNPCRAPSRNTRNRPWRGDKWAWLVLFLHKLGLDQRLIMAGARRIRVEDEVEIKLLGF